jgi:hypothetical protein
MTKALTLTEPYASLVARGVKRIETRSWSTSYRGPIAIHAAAGFAPLRKLGYPGTLDGMREMIWDTRSLWEACNAASDGPGGPLSCGWLDQGRVFPLPFSLTLGKIIAVAELVDCLPTVYRPGAGRSFCPPPLARRLAENGHETACGDFSPGRYAWILENVRQVEPLSPRDENGRHPFAQGLWTVPGPIEFQLRAQLLAESQPTSG